MPQQIHICIASDQTLQNLIPAYQLKADSVVIVDSEQMQSNTHKMRDWLTAKNIQVLIASDLMKKNEGKATFLPSNILKDIHQYGEKLINLIQAQYPEGEIILNATGGNKLMAWGLMISMRAKVDQVIYADTANEQIEYLIPKGKDYLAPAKMEDLNVQDYLFAQGYQAQTQQPQEKTALLADVQSRLKLTSYLAKNTVALTECKMFSQMNVVLSTLLNPDIAYEERKGKKQTQIDAIKDSKIAQALEQPIHLLNEAMLSNNLVKNVLSIAHEIGLIDWQTNTTIVRFANKKAASYFNGDWLEEFVWSCGIVADTSQTAISDIQLNVTFAHENTSNELDLLAISQNQLLVVECKTINVNSKHHQEKGSLNDIAYKLNSLSNKTKGKFGSAWLVLSSPLDEHEEKDIDFLNRAKALNITVIPGQRLIHLKDDLIAWAKSKQTPSFPPVKNS